MMTVNLWQMILLNQVAVTLVWWGLNLSLLKINTNRSNKTHKNFVSPFVFEVLCNVFASGETFYLWDYISCQTLTLGKSQVTSKTFLKWQIFNVKKTIAMHSVRFQPHFNLIFFPIAALWDSWKWNVIQQIKNVSPKEMFWKKCIMAHFMPFFSDGNFQTSRLWIPQEILLDGGQTVSVRGS